MKGLFILLSFAITACNSANVSPKASTAQDTAGVGRTVDQVKAERPKFEGYEPTPYILGQDTSYIRIVANRDILQKAWLVYYDATDRKWSTITWTGQGSDNKIIGDTVFARPNGLVNGASTEDAPLFYAAYSLDSGKTWQPHQLHTASYRCSYTGVRSSFRSALLVSNDYINETGRPGVSFIIQNPKQSGFNASGLEATKDFTFFCPVTRQLPLRP